jgi:hypothetical protein
MLFSTSLLTATEIVKERGWLKADMGRYLRDFQQKHAAVEPHMSAIRRK